MLVLDPHPCALALRLLQDKGSQSRKDAIGCPRFAPSVTWLILTVSSRSKMTEIPSGSMRCARPANRLVSPSGSAASNSSGPSPSTDSAIRARTWPFSVRRVQLEPLVRHPDQDPFAAFVVHDERGGDPQTDRFGPTPHPNRATHQKRCRAGRWRIESASGSKIQPLSPP